MSSNPSSTRPDALDTLDDMAEVMLSEMAAEYHSISDG